MKSYDEVVYALGTTQAEMMLAPKSHLALGRLDLIKTD